MNNKIEKSIDEHYSGVAKNYSEQYKKENLETLNYYPANYFRLQILTNLIAKNNIKSIYEAGVGDGTPLIQLSKMGIRVAGSDLAAGMIDVCKKNFTNEGLDQLLIQQADIEDSNTFCNQISEGKFDAVICSGVLPHIKNEKLFLQNIKMLLNSNGTVFISFRNKLFSLFTFNRNTKEFIINDLLKNVSNNIKEAVDDELNARLAINLPEKRLIENDIIGAKGNKGYDTMMLTQSHNPFELEELFKINGFYDIKFHWYHYHAGIPMLEKKLGSEFRSESFNLEHEETWRGMFLCSAGIIEAKIKDI